MKPILFNTDMVRAILEGRKTVTRRVVKVRELIDCPPYRPGDILYVRETWTHTCLQCCKRYPDEILCPPDCGTCPEFVYKADGVLLKDERWRPSIHMPRAAARIFLRVTGVRVERLNEITEEQGMAEGAHAAYPYRSYIDGFASLWDSTIKPADCGRHSWGENPYVWVIEFDRISKEEAYSHETQHP